MKTIGTFFLRVVALLGVAAGTAWSADYRVTIEAEGARGVISRHLMGFNAIYSNEPDAQWQRGRGKIPELLAEVNTGIVRYPAGTVTTFYHWREPTVPGWKDSWAPDYDPTQNKPATDTMDIDEYLDFVALRGITPLVGVNLGSGKKYDRVAEGLAEAKALVRHCLQRGAKVKYFYLDNEPYQHDANYTFTPEEYAEQINLYAPALKEIDPSIEIIVNLHPSPTKREYTRTVVERAGANIDWVDLHFYWRHGNATFANWAAEPRMTHQRTRPYAEQRDIHRKLFAEWGHPHIELAVLEWNIGPARDLPPPTPAEAALMVSEFFLQLVQGEVKMATFWPLHWPGADWSRSLLGTARDFAPNKVYGVFRLLADLPGRTLLRATVEGAAQPEWLTCVAARDGDGRTVQAYLLNKNSTKESATVELALEGFPTVKQVRVETFDRHEESAGPLKVSEGTLERLGEGFRLTLPSHTFAKVVFELENRN